MAGIEAYGNLTINGGTITAYADTHHYVSIDSVRTLSINGGQITADASIHGGSVIINGGTISATNKVDGAVTINGGNIMASSITNPINAAGVTVTQKTYTFLPSSITDSAGKTYGMNDVALIGGMLYAWLDQNAYYSVTTPASVTVDGVTASASIDKTVAMAGTSVNVTVTLSGTALKQGTYTVGLTGASANPITAPATVTKDVAVGNTPTDTFSFTFAMPGANVSDLAVTLDFAEDTKYAVIYSATDATGGTMPTGGSYYVGQTYTVDSSADAPSKAGYTFEGWSTDGTSPITGTKAMGSTNSTVLEIAQPFSFSGKTDVTVWRCHNGTSEKLTQLTTKPVSPFTDGTYFADSQNGLIYIYAAKFSTYAVSYQDVIPAYVSVITGNSVTVKSSENGTVKADKATASSGDKVTLTVTPNAGCTLKGLSVTDKNGKSIDLTDNHNNTFTFTMPNSSVTVSAEFLKQSQNPFIDVADNSYYYDAVLWAVEKGITNGTSATTFSPNMICTRAQTVTFLWRAMGSPEPTVTSCPFTDVKKDVYYYKAVLWATEKGITIGTSSTTFSPEDTVTRGQTVTFLWRTAGKSAVTTANPFGDISSDAYYANAVLWAVSNNITTGTSALTFSPADGCTRAQIVTFLYRYISK